MKRILKIGALATLLLTAVFWMVGTFYEKDIGKIVLNRLDQQIQGSMTYEDFSISLFGSFPNVGADFSGLKVIQNDKNIIDADQFAIELDLFKMIQKVVKINGVEINSGDLHIIRDSFGKTNLETLFSSQDAGASSQVIYLDNIVFKDVHVRYQDDRSKDEYRVHIDNGELNVSIKEKLIKINTNGRGKIDFISIANLSYAENQLMSFEGDIHVIRDDNLYKLNQVGVEIGDNRALLSGTIQSLNEGMKYDLELNNVKSEIGSLVKSLPKEYSKFITGYNISGVAEGKVRINGVMNDKVNPYVSITSSLSNGAFGKKNKVDLFQGISGQVTFNNGPDANLKTSVLHAVDIATSWNDQVVRSNFNIKNFYDPKAEGNVHGELKLHLFEKYFLSLGIDDIKGSVYINELSFKDWRLSDSDYDTFKGLELKGACSLKDIACKIKDEKIYIADGELFIAEDRLMLEDAHTLIGVSDLEMDATLDGLKSGILSGLKTSNLAAVIKSKHINGLELWELYKRIKTKEELAIPVNYSAGKQSEWYTRIRSSVELKAETFEFGKVKAKDLSGSIQQEDRVYDIETTAQAFEGRVNISSNGSFTPYIIADTKIESEKINISLLFEQFENFDQKFINSDHLSGIVNSKSHVKCLWDKNGDLDRDNLEMDAFFEIKQGELKDLDVLTQFADYVDISELKNVKFSKMSNLIEVRKGEVFIPAMFIQNSACNMMVSGFHSIDQNIHYNVKVNASQTIGNKLKRRKEKNKIIPAQKNGWLNMYFNIDGTVDNYTFELNKSLVKRGFDYGEKRKIAIIERLSRHFGPLVQFEEPLDWIDIPEYDEGIEIIDNEDVYID